eukprot:TRINITY_DN8192_c0_g1_i1.p1 TRINITY_DN8192_c0_g1~~TRINITY_DN8192_c0_g1_i1.p1  ORF type:complete len:399 (-),score=165.87 TRINITY_DN8192_c0_g1_i1:32-1228(-)
MRADEGRIDDLNFSIANEIIDTLLQQQQDYEDQLAMQEKPNEKQVAKDRADMKQKIEDIVKDCLHNLHKIDNLLALTQTMSYRKEFPLVIRIGNHCLSKIDSLLEELELREELQDSLNKLAEKVTLQKDGITKKQQTEQENLTAKLEKLPKEFADRAQLDQWTLQACDMMTNAAKIEDNDQVLKELTTRAFKVEVTPERWNKVKQLTAEQDWEEVKKELVVYLLKASTSVDPNSKVNPMVQIDLLLREGLWKECIEIFPAPTGRSQELDVLINMWVEVEKNQPNALPELIPIVEKYIKRFYQDGKHTEFERVLEQVQRSCPNQICDLYAKGSEVLLINMIPSKYQDYVVFIKAFRKRMDALGKRDKFDKFFSEFKKVNKTKKKLMNMVNLISESFAGN